ncbi:YD repeat-containing protein [Alcanivorax sp. 521-1]|uniref:YD repeat-containing protein n=1 Tax=Alloalcanivorax profundimaris TaxID=2735259 RepID=A0ABS0AL57_9GAMM|nr:RHS repeat-associated core domain-containing protein [Alloalcanivorax profundimaris]MBF5054866.1 YD repeat-containing protein [Alloalcanivorax profundimaris]
MRSQTRKLFGTLVASIMIVAGLCMTPGTSEADIPGFPPSVYTISDRGVDLRSGSFVFENEDIGIGTGDGRLALNRQFNSEFMDYKGPFGFGTSHNFDIKIAMGEYQGEEVAVVTQGFVSDILEKKSEGQYVSQKDPGVTLTTVGGSGPNDEKVATYVLRDGTEFRFEKVKSHHLRWARFIPCGETDCGYLKSITKPNGEKITFQYEYFENFDTDNPYDFGLRRLEKVSSSRGYELRFRYTCAVWNSGPVCVGIRADVISQVQVVNLGHKSLCFMSLQCSPEGGTFWDGKASYFYHGDTGTLWEYTVNDVKKRYQYDQEKRITAIKKAGTNAGSLRGIAYSGEKVSQVSDGEFRTWSYSFSGGTSTETDPSGASQIVSFQDKKRPVSWTDRRGNTTEYKYDGYDRLTRVVYPEKNETRFTYDARSNVTKVAISPSPGSGDQAVVESAGYPSGCAPADRKVCNKPLWTEDANGSRTHYTYAREHGGLLTVTRPPDESGSRSRITHGYSALSTRKYDQATDSLVRSPAIYLRVKTTETVGDGNSRVTAYEYDSGPGFWKNLNQTAKEVSSGGVSIRHEYTYDYYGNLISEDGPLAGDGDASYYQYDAEGRLVLEVGPAGASGSRRAQRYQYNDDGWLMETNVGTASVSGTGFSTFMSVSYSYNGAGDLVSESGFNGNIDYGYDDVGRLRCEALRASAAAGNPCRASVLSATSDQVTEYQYDASGNLLVERRGVTVSGLEQAYVSYTYDKNGEVTSLLDAAGNRTAYQRDGFGRLARITFPDPEQTGEINDSDYIAYTYDALGQVVTKRRRDGSTVSYEYDALGRRTGKSYPSNPAFDVHYRYNHLGDLAEASFVNDASRTVTFTYDGLGRLTGRSDWIGSVSYDYDLAGNRTRMAIAGADAIEFNHDAASNLTAVGFNGTRLVGLTHDGLNRIRELSRQNGTYSRFSYDGDGNLIAQDQGGFANSDYNVARSFSYYRVGQLKSENLSNPAYEWPGPGESRTDTAQYDGLNREASGAVQYDARGNVKSAAGASYLYTPDNRLASINKGTDAQVELIHGPLGQLREIRTSDQIRRFLYDGPDLIAEYDGQNDLLVTYAHGEGYDNPLVACLGGVCDFPEWFHADRLGSVSAISDTCGYADRYRYGPYGESEVFSADNGPRFGYTGQLVLEGTGLYHYKSRTYSPELGRFLQPDTIGYGDGPNMYLYTGADPVNNTDPTGQCPICIGALAGGLIGGAISYVESGGDLGATLKGFGSGALMGAAFGALGPVAVRGATLVGRSVFRGTRITTTTTRTTHRLEPIVVRANGKGLETRGYRPKPGERTIQGQVDAATNNGVRNPTVQRGGQDLFRMRSGGHGRSGASVTPQNVRNVAPNNRIYMGKGPDRTVGSKDIRELYKAQTGHGTNTFRTKSGR